MTMTKPEKCECGALIVYIDGQRWCAQTRARYIAMYGKSHVVHQQLLREDRETRAADRVNKCTPHPKDKKLCRYCGEALVDGHHKPDEAPELL